MKKVLLYMICMFLITSCNQDSIPTGGEEQEARTDIKAAFGLQVDHSMDVMTRSSASVDSCAIKNLWILQFSTTTGALLSAPQYLDESTDLNQHSIEAKLKSGASNIYFVANTFSSACFNSGNCATESAFKGLSKTYTSPSDIQGELANDKLCLPMTGTMLNQTLASGNIDKALTVDLKRSVALIDLTYTVDFPDGEDFTVNGVRICNVYKKMWYTDHTVADFTSDADADYCDYTLETPAEGDGTTGHFLFYVPENMKGDNPVVNTNPLKKAGITGKKCTYIEIRGYSKSSNKFGVYRIYPGDDNLNNYNIRRNNRYATSINLKGLSLYDSRTLVAVNEPEANSYIVTPSTLIMIPLKIANTEAVGRGVAAPVAIGTTQFTADMLWTDNVKGMNTDGVIESVTADPISGYVRVKTGTATGNAVVYAKVGDNIVWSWHVWVTKYNPDAISGEPDRRVYTYSGLTWMDRNLGASTPLAGTPQNLGFIYQWGRKDPFPGASVTNAATTTAIPIYDKNGVALTEGNTGTGVIYGTVISSTPSVGIQNSIRNPLTYYTSTVNYSDWCTVGTNSKNDLWGGASTTSVVPKTVYDPCPPGWRVPVWNPTSPFPSTTTAPWNYGYDLTSLGINNFPAEGYRRYDTAILNEVSTVGTYWTATSAGSGKSYFFRIDNTGSVTNNNQGARGYGLSVRCVKETIN